MDNIPHEIGKQVLKVGKVEWGVTDPMTDEELVAWFRDMIAATRKHFNITSEKIVMHGLWETGENVAVCHTGMSPNSPIHAQALVGAWNRLVDDCEAQKRPVARKG